MEHLLYLLVKLVSLFEFTLFEFIIVNLTLKNLFFVKLTLFIRVNSTIDFTIKQNFPKYSISN